MRLTNFGPNETEIQINGLTLFFSYSTLVAVQQGNDLYDDDKVFITEKFWSKTTTRHIGGFLGRRDVPEHDRIRVPQAFLDEEVPLRVNATGDLHSIWLASWAA